MRVLSLLLALSSLSSGAVDQYTGYLDGIQTAISYLTFDGADPEDYFGTACTNKLVVTSMWAAAKVYCTTKQIEAGFQEFAGYCSEYGSVELVPYTKVLPLLTNDYIKSLPVAQYSDVENATVFDTSVMISTSLYRTGKDTYVCAYFFNHAMRIANKEKVVFDVEYVLHERYG